MHQVGELLAIARGCRKKAWITSTSAFTYARQFNRTDSSTSIRELVYSYFNPLATNPMIPIVVTNRRYQHQLLLLGSTFAELDNMISICKRKLLQSKLVIPRQKSNKKEHEDLTWFSPNLAYVHGERT